MKKGNEYIVVFPFLDLQDKSEDFPDGKIYAIGEIYSNEQVKEERIRELSTNKNKIGRTLIRLNETLDNEVTEEPTTDLKEVTNTFAYDDITKSQIVDILSKKGIEHNPRDTKQKLYDLLLGSE